MKILFIAHFEDGYGGIQRYGEELAAGFRSRGHKVEWLNCGPRLFRDSGRLRDWIPRGDSFRRFYWRFRYYLEDYRFHNAVRRVCRRKIAELAPDIVHCLHPYLSAAAAIRSPTVVTCLGLEVENIPPVRTSLESAAGVHSISDFTAGRVRGCVGDLNGKIKVLRWGIRSGAVQTAEPHRFHLITVGRVVERKNLDSVLRALTGLPDVRYAVVGDGPELPRLRQLAGSLGLRNVTFFGSVPDRDRDELLSQSRIFVMCPRGDKASDVEGLGLVYYEAHAHGLPVIGSANGGAPEAVGGGGLVVRNAQDPEEIRNAIVRLLQPDEYARVREAVLDRQRAESWDRFLDAFEDWYRSLTGKPA